MIRRRGISKKRKLLILGAVITATLLIPVFLICESTSLEREKAQRPSFEQICALKLGMTRGEVYRELRNEGVNVGSGIWIEQYILNDDRIARLCFYDAGLGYIEVRDKNGKRIEYERSLYDSDS